MANAADQRAFKTALKDRKFDAAYYLYGDDDFLKETAVRQLVAAAVEPATQAFNLDQRKGADLQGESLGVLLGTPPMMAERRVVVIRDVDALRKEARAALDRYLQSPSLDTVLVLVSNAGEKPDKKITERTTPVEYAPLTGAQLPKWIVQQVAQDGGGATISEGAAALLQDAVGADLGLLSLEIEKLLSFTGGKPITEDAVSAVVGVRREETLGHLLDAVAQRDAKSALAALPLVLQQPKTSAVTIVMALTVQTLALGWGQATRLPPQRLSREYFGLLKEAGSVYTGRSWGEAASAWTRHAATWSPQDVDEGLRALAQADEALKESRLSTDEQTLSTLILTLCRQPARRKVA
ncbi:MAG: DNA polymerase III subunit delta [Gemmatimonadota bacterium]|nr:DNA polymerase III subunit delta [Gemmatimonadota bacterium]